ncbi:hypothetical protein ES703_44136 [subsurface metagenome]
MHAGVMADQHQLFRIGACRHPHDAQELRRLGAIEFVDDFHLGGRHAVLHRLPYEVPGLPRAHGRGDQHEFRERRVTADPVADLGGIAAPAIVQATILIVSRRRVGLGLGMTQQQQTAHGRDLD